MKHDPRERHYPRRRRAPSRERGLRGERSPTVESRAHPYRRRRALLSRGELAFYHVLRRAVAGRWTISVKPRLADVVWCPRAQWRTAVGARVAQKHLDFVLYDNDTTEIVLAVELDDRSHARRERRLRDAFLDEVLAGCKVRFLRVRAQAFYSYPELRALLDAAMAHERGPTRWGGT